MALSGMCKFIHCLGSAIDLKFFIYFFNVASDSLHGDSQLIGHHFIAVPLGQVFKDLRFPVGQMIVRAKWCFVGFGK